MLTLVRLLSAGQPLSKYTCQRQILVVSDNPLFRTLQSEYHSYLFDHNYIIEATLNNISDEGNILHVLKNSIRWIALQLKNVKFHFSQ